jgi:hypothetical protein
MPSSPSSSCLGPRRSSSAGAATLPDERSGWTALLAAIVERAQADLVSPARDVGHWCHGATCPWVERIRPRRLAWRDHDAGRHGCHDSRLCARAYLRRLRRAVEEADPADGREAALAAVGAMR